MILMKDRSKDRHKKRHLVPVQPHLYEMLRQLAKTRGGSVTEEVRLAILKHLDESSYFSKNKKR
jgi:hypothetical protein